MSAVMDPRRILTEIDPQEVKDLLDEVGDKNYVRVVKHEAKTLRGRTTHRESFYEENRGGGNIANTVASLLKIDSLRVAKGKKPMYLDAALKRSGGRLISVTFNLRTNVGIDFAADALGGGSQPAVASYLALSNNTSGASATHASSTVPWSSAQATDAAASGTTGEYTALGVARAVATYAHTTTVASYTQTKTWTATGTVTSLQIAGMFGGAGRTAQGSGGTNILFVENTFTATSLVNNDQLTLTWTINI